MSRRRARNSLRIRLRWTGSVEDLAVWLWLLVAPEGRWTTAGVMYVEGAQVSGLPESAR
jgi:hypothetical protein